MALTVWLPPVRVTEAHLRAVDRLAQQANLTRSETVRRLIETEAQNNGVWPSERGKSGLREENNGRLVGEPGGRVDGRGQR